MHIEAYTWQSSPLSILKGKTFKTNLILCIQRNCYSDGKGSELLFVPAARIKNVGSDSFKFVERVLEFTEIIRTTPTKSTGKWFLAWVPTPDQFTEFTKPEPLITF